MAEISDADKLGMAALIASTESDNEQRVNRKKKANPLGPVLTREQIRQQDEDDLLKEIRSYMPIKKANGGMIDRAAVRGKTKGKIC